MRVVFIFRRRREGAHSIEELFHAISQELEKDVELIRFEAGSRWRCISDVYRLRALNADVYHVTGDVHYLVPFLPRGTVVLTVHDIGRYLFDLRGMRRWLYKWIWLLIPMRTARVVTAVSSATRDNILKYLEIGARVIEVVENCHSPNFRPVKTVFRADCPTILQVGTRPFKNVPRLIEAIQGLNCRLILVGALDDQLLNVLKESGVQFENHRGISHSDLYQHYIRCDIVSFVSLGEGFGVPIIEAQAVGRPVITADLSPMREIAGPGSVLVDPTDVSEIRKGIQRLASDDDYRRSVVECGFTNVRRFSPVAISARYLAIYRTMVA